MAYIAFLQSSGGTEDIWKWIASGLLAILGWIWGKKDGRKDTGGEKESWFNEREAIRLRLDQLEEENDEPNAHPVAVNLSPKIEKLDYRIMRLEDQVVRIERKLDNKREE